MHREVSYRRLEVCTAFLNNWWGVTISKQRDTRNLRLERLILLALAIVNEGRDLPGRIFGITTAITVSTLHRVWDWSFFYSWTYTNHRVHLCGFKNLMKFFSQSLTCYFSHKHCYIEKGKFMNIMSIENDIMQFSEIKRISREKRFRINICKYEKSLQKT